MIFNVSDVGNAKPFAVIHANYPEDSVCTCTDGTKTVKPSNLGRVNYSGNPISIVGNDPPVLKTFLLYGRSTQQSAPTIASPVVVDDLKNPKVFATGKNLLRFPYAISGGTTAGISYTFNADGSVTLNGKATSTGQLSFQRNLSLTDIPNGRYIAYLAADKNCKATFRTYGWTSGTFVGVGTNNSKLDVKKFQIDDAWKEANKAQDGSILSSLIFYSGETYDNVTLKAMICVDTGETTVSWDSPKGYKEAALTATLRGIPVTSGGNYTDETGQQWIADVLRVRSDGTGEIERRVGTKAVPSNVAGGFENQTNRVFYIGKAFLNDVMKPNSPVGSSAVLCNALKFYPNGNAATVADNGCYISGSSKTTIFFRNTSASSFSEALAALVAAKATFWYALAAPTIETLSASQVQAVLGLKTYAPASFLFNDKDAGMELYLPSTDRNTNFLIPYAGVWKVSCTDGTDQDNKDVTITKRNQLESVSLSYRMTPEFTYTGKYEVVDDSNNAIADFATWLKGWKIRFLTSGTFTITRMNGFDGVLDIFAVGAGGGAGGILGRGGGGGYTTTKSSVTVTANTPYTVTIGAGGAKGSGSGDGANGGNSAFSTIVSAAGGKGSAVGDGGSGGSGFQNNGASNGANGVVGTSSPSTYTCKGQGSTTREFGSSTGMLYAGGGGSELAKGGAGGGGDGCVDYSHAASSGATNTGGGGGGGHAGSSTVAHGAGGSGIVIIRNHR